MDPKDGQLCDYSSQILEEYLMIQENIHAIIVSEKRQGIKEYKGWSQPCKKYSYKIKMEGNTFLTPCL